MRKIETQAEIDKKKRKNQFIIGGVMIVLLMLSIIGYSFSSGINNNSQTNVNEMGFEFIRYNGLWALSINDEIFYFQNLPSEISDISINTTALLSDYYQKPLYFINPNEGASEILNNIGNYILRYQEACLEGLNCEDDLPIKTCDDNLIIFLDGDDSFVYEDGNCIFVVGDSIKATDAFLYKALQIT